MATKTATQTKQSAAAWRDSRSIIAVRLRASWSGSAGIIRAFAGNRDVMGVAFTKSGVGYAYKGGAVAEIGKVAPADITHSGFQAARKLVQNAGHRSFVRHLPFDAFRHQFQRVTHLGLEIAVG